MPVFSTKLQPTLVLHELLAIYAEVTVLLLPLRAQMTNSRASGNFRNMVREISAGGVVIRNRNGTWWMAVLEPAGNPSRTTDQSRTGVKRARTVLALPKGLVDPGEKPLETALREVYEETGITAELVTKLADIKYVYTRAWGDGQRVFKIVSFFLMRYVSGRINKIAPDMRIEVARARWIRLQDAAKLLAYKGEKQMAQRALEYLQAHVEPE
jgi:8-oxo-dGTP pyrophosphatase MutT (NUDIX family)